MSIVQLPKSVKTKIPVSRHAGANASQALQAAIDTANALGGAVVEVPYGLWSLTSKVILKSYVILWMYGALIKIANGANIDAIEIASGATMVGIFGGEIDGNKDNNTLNGNGICNDNTAIFTHVRLKDVVVHDCKNNCIFLDGIDANNTSKYLQIEGCTVQDAAVAGISGNYIEEFAWVKNTAINNGTHGIGWLGVAAHGTLTGNTASGSVAADNFTGYNTANKHITLTGNISKGGANNGIHLGGTGIIMNSNEIYNPAQHGIVAYNHAGNVGNSVVMNGNVVIGAGQSGIWLDKINKFTLGVNEISGCGSHGIWLDGTNSKGTVSGNTVEGNGADGIRTQNSSYIAITGNVCASNASDGIELAITTDCTVAANVCTGNASPFRESGASNWNKLTGNVFRGNTSDTATIVGANTTIS